VIPRRHARDLLSIEAEDLEACIRMAQRVATVAKDTFDADGITMMQSTGAAAWQTVFHFHIHVIPRYADDPLRLPVHPQQASREELGAVAAELRG
jgi:histidine triad (HIT) family protein